MTHCKDILDHERLRANNTKIQIHFFVPQQRLQYHIAKTLDQDIFHYKKASVEDISALESVADVFIDTAAKIFYFASNCPLAQNMIDRIIRGSGF